MSKALELVLLDLKDRNFALQIDVLNRTNVKLFPLCVQYFSRNDGLCDKLIIKINLFENISYIKHNFKAIYNSQKYAINGNAADKWHYILINN